MYSGNTRRSAAEEGGTEGRGRGFESRRYPGLNGMKLSLGHCKDFEKMGSPGFGAERQHNLCFKRITLAAVKNRLCGSKVGSREISWQVVTVIQVRGDGASD